MTDKTNTSKRDRGSKLKDYGPLFSLISVSLLSSLALAHGTQSDFMTGMHYFMGIFFCIFALLKIFNLKGFANGFQMYDLLGSRLRLYALAYPFIELALGLGYLSFIAPQFVYSATIIVMGLGALGVLDGLRRKININCPCMGSTLEVPLSTVTLTEDISMGLMAAYMLFMM